MEVNDFEILLLDVVTFHHRHVENLVFNGLMKLWMMIKCYTDNDSQFVVIQTQIKLDVDHIDQV